MAGDGKEFLSRWSRLKREAREQPAPLPAAAPKTDGVPRQLPPLEELDFDSDFRAFLDAKVDESLRRAALKKLFNDPRFNVMDGLDVYIDDYGKPDPLPEGMLERLAQWQNMLAARAQDQAEENAATPGGVAGEPPGSSGQLDGATVAASLPPAVPVHLAPAAPDAVDRKDRQS